MVQTFPFLNTLREGSRSIAIGGLWGSSRAYLLSLFRQHCDSPYLVVTASQKQAEELYEDLKFFFHTATPHHHEREVLLYSQWDIGPYEEASPHREIVAERLSILDKLLNHETIIVVAPVTAVMHRTLSRNALKEFTLYTGVGEELDRENLLSMLVDTGYKHTALVEDRGEFSVRGGIIDLFRPYRTLTRCYGTQSVTLDAGAHTLTLRYEGGGDDAGEQPGIGIDFIWVQKR